LRERKGSEMRIGGEEGERGREVAIREKEGFTDSLESGKGSYDR